MDYEILAPAGSIPDLKIMLEEQADAIYVGLNGFSSRPSSADFSVKQIGEAITLCHAQSVPLYVAINANVGQGQMDELIEQILQIDAMGADAFILAEFGLVQALSGKLKHAALHASTLMGVYNIETVRLLQSMGVSRIVLYANLYFEEIAQIIRAVPEMEYELVAEGGTCFNDICRCHIPHAEQNGEHILYCRKEFQLYRKEITGPAKPISEPPTRTAEIIGLYMAIGVKSYKVEGRTVPAAQRVPMVRALRGAIGRFGEQDGVPGTLHYFFRGNAR